MVDRRLGLIDRLTERAASTPPQECTRHHFDHAHASHPEVRTGRTGPVGPPGSRRIRGRTIALPGKQDLTPQGKVFATPVGIRRVPAQWLEFLTASGPGILFGQ